MTQIGAPTRPSQHPAAGLALSGTDKSLFPDLCPVSGSTPNTWPASKPGQGQIRMSGASGTQEVAHSWKRLGWRVG